MAGGTTIRAAAPGNSIGLGLRGVPGVSFASRAAVACSRGGSARCLTHVLHEVIAQGEFLHTCPADPAFRLDKVRGFGDQGLQLYADVGAHVFHGEAPEGNPWLHLWQRWHSGLIRPLSAMLRQAFSSPESTESKSDSAQSEIDPLSLGAVAEWAFARYWP